MNKLYVKRQDKLGAWSDLNSKEKKNRYLMK